MLKYFACITKKRTLIIRKLRMVVIDVKVKVMEKQNAVSNAYVKLTCGDLLKDGYTDENGEIVFEDLTVKDNDLVAIEIDIGVEYELKVIEDWEEYGEYELRITEDWEDYGEYTLRVTEDWEEVYEVEVKVIEDWEEWITTELRITEDWEY